MGAETRSYLQTSSREIKDSAVDLAYKILNASDQFEKKLEYFDQSQLQKHVWSRIASEYGKELYQSGIQQYADDIVGYCSEQKNSKIQCINSGLLNTSLGGLNAADPLFYLKSVFVTVNTLLYKDGYYTKDQATRIRQDIDYVFIIADLAKLYRLSKKFKNLGDLKKLPRTAAGEYDRRFRTVKQLMKIFSQALESAVTNVGKDIVDWQKTNPSQ
jgi:hypothetical protein